MATGSVASPVSAETVMSPPVPTFTVATARVPAGVALLMLTMPSFIGVAASATISGVGDVDADNNSVLSPVVIDAGLVFEHSKFSRTSVGGMGPVGVNATTKLCAAPGATSAGVFSEPVRTFVTGFVV